jgi:FAD dependent oxidoreductase
MDQLTAEVLVVGGGTGGTVAAIQAARSGAQTILVSEGPWLGGMLTAAGVAAPDGNELLPWQTGLWAAFLRELQQRQPQGLDHAWVSFFTYDPGVGAQIFADWVQALPNLNWILGQTPQAVLRRGDLITGVEFETLRVQAQITLDGTELGDLLALAEIPHHWGWEWQSVWGEVSAPPAENLLTRTYPIQVPTWVVVMQDYGQGAGAPEIPPAPTWCPDLFDGATAGYSSQQFWDYGRLPAGRLMLNWPQRGNDYGEGVDRLIGSRQQRSQFLQEARWHSQNFAHFLQGQFGRRYGLAPQVFPQKEGWLGGGAFALQPYHRESRRLQGITTVIEPDLLPLSGGNVAPLPDNNLAEVTAIAIGNYANDHHYPSGDIALQAKSLRWGGRVTGTPFTVPYTALVPAQIDGFLVCEKNISVSHIANGATRLQPLVMAIGQAAGLAAALCVQRNCQPRDLPVAVLQDHLLTDPQAPAAVIPLFNLVPDHPDWLQWQRYYLQHPHAYPPQGDCPNLSPVSLCLPPDAKHLQEFTGIFEAEGHQRYTLRQENGDRWQLVTLDPQINQDWQIYPPQAAITVQAWPNLAGKWLRVYQIG